MATTDTTINNLIINKLTKAQYYDIENPSETEMYLVPDEIDNIPTENSVNPVKSGGVYTALAGKQDTITGGASTITSSNLTASRALISNLSGKVAVSDVTSTELSYLSGATSNVQTQLNAKQDALESGTNIKTINSTSLLGSGNISISTGTPIVTQTASSVEIAPNCLNQWGEIATLTITLAIPSDATIVNEYMIEFESGSTATTLTLPNTIVWGDNCGAISVEANKIYLISIVNNLATWESWATA